MRIDFCGVRGSTPAVGAAFVAVGGNTSCLALTHHDERVPRLVLDAGTGLRNVSALLSGSPFQGTILIGHLHWDHTHGLPFFRAGDHPDATTRVLIPRHTDDAVTLLTRIMSPPHFPISPAELRGTWSFDSIDEGDHVIEGFRVLAREIPHKGGRTFGFRISDEESSIAYLSDHGPAGVFGPGPAGIGPFHSAARELCEGVDVLIHDAQYTAHELPTRVTWGHSAAEYPVELARLCGAKQVVLFHHDPDRTDEQVADIERSLNSTSGLPVSAAREGVTLVLDRQKERQ